ncbi:hypothetical protein G6O69_36785 [Pseudenhygromyxa sp. WMMC2535]|uniref:hypothetical protein n=1 Tax=Pseudenhygromyxa sp. WMMC2535 TaxID=2712867 RepID=UPI0015525CB2|nr:hypothetical protein [Pseudenhygromyxa sp. WMMC2535]NVB37250.1 hypothetical protein [Pseudenhygromyxa sp. WMMC2535]NVB43438.1 hypothetical protein [Pseudenhygromyxa sp. WMMC2535]
MSQSEFLIDPGDPGPTLSYLQKVHGTSIVPVVPGFTGEIASNIKLKRDQLSVEAAANIGYGGIFEVSSKGSSTLFVLDYMMRGSVSATSDPAKVLVSAVYGVGFRIALAATKIEGELQASVAGVAAQAQLGMASVRINIDIIGLPKLPPDSVQSSLLGFSEFNAEQLGALNKTIEAVKRYAEDPANRDQLDPQLIGINAKRVVDDVVLEQSKSIIYALWRIANGSSLSAALAAPDKHNLPGIQPALVRSTYADVIRNTALLLPSTLDKEKPSYDDRNRARRRLNQYKTL